MARDDLGVGVIGRIFVTPDRIVGGPRNDQAVVGTIEFDDHLVALGYVARRYLGDSGRLANTVDPYYQYNIWAALA